MLLLPLTALIACQDTAVHKVVVTSPSQTGALSVSPSVVEFGWAAPGDVQTALVTLTSVGSGPVQIDDLRVVGASAFTVTSPGATTLPVGQSLDVAVTWTPASYNDQAYLQIHGDASTPEVQVALVGEGEFPGIQVDPPSATLEADFGSSATQSLTITSVGAADLVVSQDVLTGTEFTLDDAFVPLTLTPGARATVSVTYTPTATSDAADGELWLATNAADPSTLVPLYGSTAPTSYSMGEAWDRGLLTIESSFRAGIRITNLDPLTPIAMDQWFLLVAPTSQDAIAGSMVPGDLTLLPNSTNYFAYDGTSANAWYCIEYDQYTNQGAPYTFLGAHAPEPLLGDVLTGDQDGSWAAQTAQAVIAVGRTSNYVEVGAGESVATGIVVLNIGSMPGDTTASETVPAGFAASGFSVEPDRAVAGADGSTTYTWALSLDGRNVAPNEGNTTYDERDITYALTRTGDCSGRQTAPEASAEWDDADGAETSTANALTIRCL